MALLVLSCLVSLVAPVSFAAAVKTTTDIRLVRGESEASGRVEVRYNGTWGTVCDDNFDSNEAQVICRSLGYKYALAFGEAKYGAGRGQIWLDNLMCDGSETSLSECPHSGWGNTNCYHFEDASVQCNNTQSTKVDIRLVGGPADRSGRVELQYEGEWGTVCDDGFGSEEARVICKSLGYRYGKAIGSAHFGEGSGPIWLDDLECSGLESSLAECTFRAWNSHDCDHSEDAGVECTN